MARIARVVVPDVPHHVTQRGNRRQKTFFNDDDYRTYLSLTEKFCRESQTQIWAYCLMPNHVHLVMVPAHEDGLRKPLAAAHRRYTGFINSREGWRGHLWQERFYSAPMDERHLLATVRYVERNPVEAGLCDNPAEWRWSSAEAHLVGRSDGLVRVQAMLDRVSDWASYLAQETDPETLDTLERNLRVGRPLGGPEFVERVEKTLGRCLQPKKRGRPPHKDE